MGAFNYFHTNAGKFNIDSNRMAVCGESGGCLIVLGALRHMIKSGDISKVRVAFLQEPFIGGDINRVTNDELTKIEMQIDW